MNKIFRTRSRLVVLLMMAVVLSAATYGFAAGNTVPDGVGGEGTGDISGYVVTNVVYTLDSNDPTQFLQVTFDLDDNATDVYAGLQGSTLTFWTSCGGGPTSFTCSLAGSTVSVNDAVFLHVSSVQ